MITICAWCPDARQKMEAAAERGEEVTHGICEMHIVEFEADQDGHEETGGPKQTLTAVKNLL